MPKRWPTYDDLLAWYLFRTLDECEMASPDDMKARIEEFDDTPPAVMHKRLYDGDLSTAEFAEEFEHYEAHGAVHG